MSPTTFSDSVSVIDTATNTVLPIAVGNGPFGVAVTPDGSRVYVADFDQRHRVGDRHRNQHGARANDPGRG